mmetsp:Transcript_30797/g.73449  ORF Transcript_30797/g.73449 Transcript_30797/m.73449 type:complete len:279 (+) Transcript_30797:56-892(+)
MSPRCTTCVDIAPGDLAPVELRICPVGANHALLRPRSAWNLIPCSTRCPINGNVWQSCVHARFLDRKVRVQICWQGGTLKYTLTHIRPSVWTVRGRRPIIVHAVKRAGQVVGKAVAVGCRQARVVAVECGFRTCKDCTRNSARTVATYVAPRKLTPVVCGIAPITPHGTVVRQGSFGHLIPGCTTCAIDLDEAEIGKSSWLFQWIVMIYVGWQLSTVVQAFASMALVQSVGVRARRVVWTALVCIIIIITVRSVSTSIIAIPSSARAIEHRREVTRWA